MAYNNQAPAPLNQGEIELMQAPVAAQKVGIHNLQTGAFNAINAVEQGGTSARGQLENYYGQGMNYLETLFSGAQGSLDTNYGQAQGALASGYSQAQGALAGGVAANQSALTAYFQMLGINQDGSFASSQTVQDRLAGTPGYQFIQQQGIDQINANAASRGYLNSGNTLKAALDYTTGVASANYNNFVGQLANAVGVTSPYVMQSSSLYADQGTKSAGLFAEKGANAANLFAQQGSAGLGAALSTGGLMASSLQNEGDAIAGIYSNLFGGIAAISGSGGGGGGGGGSPRPTSDFMGNLATMLAADFGGNPAASSSPWAAGGAMANSIGKAT